MKTSKKILLTALSATLATTLTSGLALTAFADTATKDHEYDVKNDVVFEDFDRADISDTVLAYGTGVATGEKPYMRVPYTAGSSVTPGDAIYKQGSGSLAQVVNGGTIKLKMRAPESDVELSEIKFGIRGVDNDNAVFAKTLDELTDSEGNVLPELSTEWKDYEISFATSYEDTDIYPTTETPVLGTSNVPLLAIHIYAATEEDEGTLDIASIEYTTTGSAYLNDFRGGATPSDTAAVADSGTWWSGSSTGYIVKRTVNMTSGSFTVTKEEAVGDYKYAIIEAEGDVENLKVATTTDGTTWGDAEAYDRYSVVLTGEEKGFKFSYDGEEESGVTVKRIYLTNLTVKVSAIATPVIDASTAQMLEDFSVAQSGFNDKWEEMSTAPELDAAGLNYRISYSNGDKVKVENGCIVFDGTELGDGYINYKFYSKTLAAGKYAVLKVKGENGANLGGLRFNLMGSSDATLTREPVWSHAWKSGVDYPTALMTAANPYIEDGWYYIVIDTEESGLGVDEAGYGGMDMYFSGEGKLYIDCIFFANKLANIEKDVASESKVEYDGTSTEGYNYAYLYVPNEAGNGTTLSFDITAKDDGFDISSLRFGIGAGTYWATENAEGTLITTDGKKLSELTYTKDVATHIVIDLAENGIVDAFKDVHVHMGMMKAYSITNVSLHTSTPAENITKLSDVVKELEADKNINFTADADDYQYVGGIEFDSAKYGKLEFTITPEDAEFDVSGIRFEMAGGTYWASENTATLKTVDGKMLSELTYEAGKPTAIVIDLAASGVTSAFGKIDIHSNGTSTGSFKLENIKLTGYKCEYYAEQLALLPAYLDTVDPTVSISTATTATVGDEITVAYTASDDITAAADLNVAVTVTKDGNAVTLTDNKFTAEEGVYTVTVTVRDVAGNEAYDTIQITVSAAANNGGDDTNPSKGLSAGAIAGIVIGCVAAVAIAGVAVFLVIRKKKNG